MITHLQKLQFEFTFFQKSLNPILPQPLVTWYTSKGFLPLSNVLILDPPIPNTPPLLTYECPLPFLTPLVLHTSSNLISSSSTQDKVKKT